IGGPSAGKAVPVLVADLKRSERDAYNAIIYLGLLGEHGKDALPALRGAGSVGAGSAPMAIWAIEPTKQFPWQMGYAADRDCDLWFFGTFVDFLGPRASEAAQALVRAGLNGSAGDRIPTYALYLLDQQEKIAIPMLLNGITSPSAQVRKRAVGLI